MKRRDDWPTLLSAFIESRRERPFVWGQNDCCMFVADWIEQATGVDCAASLRGSYSSGLGAQRIMNEHGGLCATVIKLTGLNLIATSAAQRGDIVAQESEFGTALGICVGSMSVFVAKTGLDFAPTENSIHVFKL